MTKTPRSGNVVEATGAGEAGSARGAGGAAAPARTVGQAFERVLRWVDELRDDHEAIHAAITEGRADDAERLVERHIRRAWQTITAS